MDNTPITENNSLEKVEDLITVNKVELNALIEQNSTQKDEIGALIGLFMNFQGLFNGNSNPLTLISVIPKLLSDPKMKQQIEAILPIIEKYNS